MKNCAPEKQRFFCDPGATWEEIRAWMDEYVARAGDPAWYAASGYPHPAAKYGFTCFEYGCSKALVAIKE